MEGNHKKPSCFRACVDISNYCSNTELPANEVDTILLPVNDHM
jgi:hypothetical protein